MKTGTDGTTVVLSAGKDANASLKTIVSHGLFLFLSHAEWKSIETMVYCQEINYLTQFTTARHLMESVDKWEANFTADRHMMMHISG